MPDARLHGAVRPLPEKSVRCRTGDFMANPRKDVLPEERKELETCRERLNAIIAKCIEGVLIADEDGIIRYANEASLILFRRRAEEMVGLPFRFPLTQDESREFTIKLPGGREQTVEMAVSKTDWEGKPSWLVTLHDISARRLAERELRLLYQAVTCSPAMIVIADAEGTVVYANPKFTEVTGYATRDVVGKKAAFLDFDRMQLDDYARIWPSITGGREWSGDVVARKKDGTTYWQSIRISPVKGENGDITNFIAVAVDVTERREMEDTRGRLAAIVDSSDDAIIGKTLEGIITSWNGGAERMYGFTAAEAIGRPITLITPPERPDEIPRILEKLRSGKRVEHFVTQRITKRGKRLTVSVTISPVLDRAGRIIGASSIARDITPTSRKWSPARMLFGN